MDQLNPILEKAKAFAIERIAEYPTSLSYHNKKFVKRFIKRVRKIIKQLNLPKDEGTLTEITAWLVAGSYKNIDQRLSADGLLITNLEQEANDFALSFFKGQELSAEHQKMILEAVNEIDYLHEPKTQVGQIIFDAMTIDLISGKNNRLKRVYEQILLNDPDIATRNWYEAILMFMPKLKLHLPHNQEKYQSRFDNTISSLKKVKKEQDKQTDIVLKKELNISDPVLKELKKNIKKGKGRDYRGIQTLFRTTSKNHYTLNEMVDKKANIMITVNSIILSLLLGGIIGKDLVFSNTAKLINYSPVIMVSLTAIASITFAILAIRPGVTHGEFTIEEIKNKYGNLLYYGNFHNMKEREYEWAFLRLMNDQQYMYETMIRDIFYLGKNLQIKYQRIRLSLTIFLIGMIASVLTNVLIGVFYN